MYYLKSIEEHIKVLEQTRREKTLANYRVASRHFGTFLNAEGMGDILVTDITCKLMERYERYLRDVLHICRNTSSAYLRPLRAAYNTLVRENGVPDVHPFDTCYLGIDRTRKRALDDDDLRAIFELDLTGSKVLELTRDLFFFSFLCHGISFVDLSKLTASNIRDGTLIYERSKTRQTIHVRLDDVMRAIIDKYASAERTHLFPIVTNYWNEKEYDAAIHRYNRHLRHIKEKAGIAHSVTSYSCRHSWATQAYRNNVAMRIISQSLGHTTESTTRIYLESIDDGEVDREVKKVGDKYAHLWKG